MPTAKELIAQFNTLEGDEIAEAVKLFTNDQGDVVKRARGKIATAAKREGAGQLPEVETKLADAEAKVEALTADLATAQEKAPELSNKVTELSTKLREQEKAHKDALKAKDDALLETSRDVLVKQFSSTLASKDFNVEPDYAAEFLAPKHKDRFRRGDDGKWSVLKPGEDTPYDAASTEEAIKLLAADVAKDVKPGLILAGGDQGGGRGSGGSGGTGKPNADTIYEQKRKDSRYGNVI